MKKTLIGIALLITAALADIGVYISASILGSGLTDYYVDYGQFWTALSENGLFFLFVINKILFIIAIVILFKEYFNKEENQI